MYWNETEIKIRYSEVDRMNVVHNSKYFIFQEQAKHDFLEKNSLNKKFSDENGYFSPVIENRMIYLKPATFGEKIKVRIALFEIAAAEMKYISAIFNEKEEVLAVGFVSNCISNKKMRPLAIKKENEEEYLKFKKFEVKEKFENLNKKEIINFFKNEKFRI